MLQQWPWVLAATTAVAVVAPLTVITALPTARSLPVAFVHGLLSMTASLCTAHLGSRLWRKRSHKREVVFSDLMIWTWLLRMYRERRLQKVCGLVEKSMRNPSALSAERRLWALERLSGLVEARDPYTQGHSRRVARYSTGIAREMKLPRSVARDIHTAAMLHDVGKICTPRSILNKPGRLEDHEFAVIKRHPGQGADLLRGLVSDEILAMVRHHHERLTGNGYPDGLAGEQIPLGARIIAVADSFDAMTSTRAYRAGMPHQKALDILREESGSSLDAQAVRAFLSYYEGGRGMSGSGIASGLFGFVVPLRDVLAYAGVARNFGAVTASVALAAPVVSSDALTERWPSRERDRKVREIRADARQSEDTKLVTASAGTSGYVRLGSAPRPAPASAPSRERVPPTPTIRGDGPSPKRLARNRPTRPSPATPTPAAPQSTPFPAEPTPQAVDGKSGSALSGGAPPSRGAGPTDKQSREEHKAQEKEQREAEKEQQKAAERDEKEQAKEADKAAKEQEKVDKEARKEQEKADKEARKEQEKADKERRKEQEKADKEARKEQEKADKEARKQAEEDGRDEGEPAS